jgi:hypothetical protein
VIQSMRILPADTARHDAMLGLMGIRLDLYPDAGPFAPTPDEPDCNQQVAA